MTNIEAIQNQVEKAVVNSFRVRLYIKLASPKFGRFVKLKDYDHLIEKSMCRFVMGDNLEAFDNAHEAVKINFTKITTFESIESIVIF